MKIFDSEPPIALGTILGSEIDDVLRSAVNPQAPSLIAAIQRASRYANVSKSSGKIRFTRRVLTLGIAEMALSEFPSDPSMNWAGAWLGRVYPDVEEVLKKHDNSEAVRRALERNRKIIVHSGLAGTVSRALDIARGTSRRERIDLRHLVFALTELPGRAFASFGRAPTHAELSDLRAMIVQDVRNSADPGENPDAWQELLYKADGTPPVDLIDDPIDEDEFDDGTEPPLEHETALKESLQATGDRVEIVQPTHESGNVKDEKSLTGTATLKGPIVGEPPPDHTGTDFVDDDAESEEDQLERSILAIGLARRLHAIWRRTNVKGETGTAAANSRAAHGGSRAAFVVHIDAPWGGGKTTFANFLGRVLNPCPDGENAAQFLTDRYGSADLGGIFLRDPPPNADAVKRLRKLSPNARRPWIVVYFNAWQKEHIKPPWWVFYQTIRENCFNSIRREGDKPWKPKDKAPRLQDPLQPKRWDRWLSLWARKFAERISNSKLSSALLGLRRWDQWLSLWAKEFVWRISNPKIRSLLLTAAISLILVGFLAWTGAWGIVAGKNGKDASYILESPLGLILTGIGGITGLWGLAALFTESIVPGTDTLAERLNLGSGDPFDRFRSHFADNMERIRRPVMVIVDDLDRCEPSFVVDLIRGIQTLLRSPRVVFVILGDRDWIERAFESQHESMNKVDVGPEQTFGARFVEKAIQMSFILPELGDATRRNYVHRVALGDRAMGKRPKTPQLEQEAKAELREYVSGQAALSNDSKFDSGRIAQSIGEELGKKLDAAGVGKGSPELEQIVSDTLAILAAADEQTEVDATHELENFVQFFPANPRQIKRIINAITIYYAVAIQRAGIDPDEEFRSQLTMWVIIMTEWPQTWRLLASYPKLVTVLTDPDPDKAMERLAEDLPGSIEATANALKPIRADTDLMDLINAKGLAAPHKPLQADKVVQLASLTPLHSRVRRLPEPVSEGRSVERTTNRRAAPVNATSPV